MMDDFNKIQIYEIIPCFFSSFLFLYGLFVSKKVSYDNLMKHE